MGEMRPGFWRLEKDGWQSDRKIPVYPPRAARILMPTVNISRRDGTADKRRKGMRRHEA